MFLHSNYVCKHREDVSGVCWMDLPEKLLKGKVRQLASILFNFLTAFPISPLSVSALEHRHRDQRILIFFFFHFRSTPAAYGSSQARGQLGAAAAGHSNSGSKPCLQPILQLMAMPDPLPTEQGHWARPGIEPESSQILVGFITTEPQLELWLKDLVIWRHTEEGHSRLRIREREFQRSGEPDESLGTRASPDCRYSDFITLGEKLTYTLTCTLFKSLLFPVSVTDVTTTPSWYLFGTGCGVMK